MTFANLMGQSVDIFHPQSQVDGFGDSRHLWSDTPDETVACRLQAVIRSSSHGTKDHDERDLTGTAWKLYLVPPATGLTTYDRVRIDGKMFEIGALYPVQHPRRGLDHYVAQLTTVNNTVNYAG